MPESSTGELAREQKYVAALYERLDVLRERTRGQLDAVLAQGAFGTHQNRSERDNFAVMYTQRLARLWGGGERPVLRAAGPRRREPG